MTTEAYTELDVASNNLANDRPFTREGLNQSAYPMYCELLQILQERQIIKQELYPAMSDQRRRHSTTTMIEAHVEEDGSIKIRRYRLVSNNGQSVEEPVYVLTIPQDGGFLGVGEEEIDSRTLFLDYNPQGVSAFYPIHDPHKPALNVAANIEGYTQGLVRAARDIGMALHSE